MYIMANLGRGRYSHVAPDIARYGQVQPGTVLRPLGDHLETTWSVLGDHYWMDGWMDGCALQSVGVTPL